jgi:hypothetical protein
MQTNRVRVNRWIKPSRQCFRPSKRQHVVPTAPAPRLSRWGLKGSYTRAFFNVPGAVNIDGDKGHGWSYTNELLVDDQNMTYHLNGMYSDLYIRENGQWVFEERAFRKLHIDHPY